MKENTISTDRVEWIDLAKGFAILFVVVGHTIGLSDESLHLRMIRCLIYSFHMPLFLVLSMTTTRLSLTNESLLKKTIKSFRHLVLPSIILFLLQTIIHVISNGWYEPLSDYLARMINSAVYWSGGQVRIGSEIIPEVGYIWFFLVLFLGKLFYNILYINLSKRRLIIAVSICSVLGVALGRLQYLPLSIDIVLAILPLLAFGSFLKKTELKKKVWIYGSISLCVWLLSFCFLFFLKNSSYLDIAIRYYPMFPICYITAIGGVLFFCCICIVLSNFRKLMTPLVFIGKYSMYFFWAHIMDYIFSWVWTKFDSPLLQIVVRIIIDMVVFAFIFLVVNGVKRIKNVLYHKNKSV